MSTEVNIFAAASQMFINTPWWVWLIFAYLLYRGFRMATTRVVKIRNLIISPILFSIFSINTMKNILVSTTNLDILHWALAIVIGGALGWIHILKAGIKIDKDKIKIPGTLVPLNIFMLLFIANYFFYYKISVNPQIVEQEWYRLSSLYPSGFSMGFFLGRFICCVHLLKNKAYQAKLGKKIDF